MKTKYILGVKVDFGLGLNDVLEMITRFLKTSKNYYICTTNPEFVMAAQKDPSFKELINNSALSLPDGSGLLFANSYYEKLKKVESPFFSIKALYKGIVLIINYFRKKEEIGHQITGVSLFIALCELASKNNYTVFLLGGWPKNKYGSPLKGEYNIALDTANIMTKKYPGLKVIGSTSKFSPHEKDDIETRIYIQECMKENGIDKIDIIFVAYGHNKQESWFIRNAELIPATLGIGVGGTFDYINGNQPIPNEYILRNNLEWLYRLLTQPWRIRRTLKAFPLFPIHVYLDSIKNK